jgi:hypothetical protein
LSGCADLACFANCQRHAQNSTSLVEFLYPNGTPPPAEDSQPQLHLPKTHSLVLRAGGFDTRHGTVTLVDENRRLRETATQGFTEATRRSPRWPRGGALSARIRRARSRQIARRG